MQSCRQSKSAAMQLPQPQPCQAGCMGLQRMKQAQYVAISQLQSTQIESFEVDAA